MYSRCIGRQTGFAPAVPCVPPAAKGGSCSTPHDLDRHGLRCRGGARTRQSLGWALNGCHSRAVPRRHAPLAAVSEPEQQPTVAGGDASAGSIAERAVDTTEGSVWDAVQLCSLSVILFTTTGRQGLAVVRELWTSAIGEEASLGPTMLTVAALQACLSLLLVHASVGLPQARKWVRCEASAAGLAQAVLLVGGASAVAALYLALSQGPAPSTGGLAAVFPTQGAPSLGLAAAASVLVAPVTEELLFRGVLLAALRRHSSDVVAVAVSAGSFALMHASVSELLPLFAVGVLLGGVAVRERGNLFVPLVAHAAYNGAVVATLLLEAAAAPAGTGS